MIVLEFEESMGCGTRDNHFAMAASDLAGMDRFTRSEWYEDIVEGMHDQQEN